jgi:hypothetical protein
MFFFNITVFLIYTDYIRKKPRRAGRFGEFLETKEEILQGQLDDREIIEEA